MRADPTRAPRANRDPAEVARKRSLLHEPHVAPLTAFVERLRAQHGGDESVPWFDPTEAGVHARILALLEAPGPKATGSTGPRPKAKGSGFISADNNDRTADHVWHLLRDSGIDRAREYAAWNIVPWYVGDGRAIRSAAREDLEQARPALLELLDLMTELRVVMLLGDAAQKGWERARINRRLHVIRARHPSPQWLHRYSTARQELHDAFAQAKEQSASSRTL
jgi:hypothetical protein